MLGVITVSQTFKEIIDSEEAYDSPAVSDVGIGEEPHGDFGLVDLLEHLRRTHPEHSFALVVGSDLAAERSQWKRFDRITELARIIELRRGGFEGGIGAVLPEVSSTEVRTLLASGADVSRLVPREVLRRIRAAGTYTGGQR